LGQGSHHKPKGLFFLGSAGGSADAQPRIRADYFYYVRFSNRPVEVKRFQAVHDSSVNVTRGLALLSGIGT
jgi:hypothetical protein